jgi:hypothetical protein
MRRARKIETGDITPAEAADQMRLTLTAFTACLPSLIDRGTPARRAVYERMKQVEIDVALWVEGLDPKPRGVLLDTERSEATTERLFPASRHRSARIRKKLIKRFCAEFRKQPCIWRIGDRIVAHPSFKATIERGTNRCR